MKLFKFFSIALAFLFIGAFMAPVNAKHHRHHHKRTSFSFNLNVAPRVSPLVEYTTVTTPTYSVVRPSYVAPVYTNPVVVQPYYQPVYYTPYYIY